MKLSNAINVLLVAVLLLLVAWLSTAIVAAWIPAAPACRVVKQDGCEFLWCADKNGSGALAPLGACYVARGLEFAP